MYYYYVSTIGTGAKTDPFRPNIPDATDYVGNNFSDSTFLIGTNGLISGYSNLDDVGLQNICNQYGILYSDVQKWSLG